MAFKDFIAKVFKIERQVIVTPTEKQELSRAIEKERGRLQGEVLREKKEKEELKKKLEFLDEDKKKGSAIRLSQRQEELSNENLIGGCDWRALFKEIEKKDLKIRVVSYNLKKEFGIFDTFVTDNKGMRNLFAIDNQGIRRRVISGSKDSHIFRFPFGISKMAKKGIFIINLDENGEYVTDPLVTEIPDLIVDVNGKYDLSKVNQEPFIDKYIKLNSELNDSHSKIETYEKTIAEIIRKENLTKHQLNVAKSRAETAESELSENIKKITEMHSTYSDVIYRNNLLSQQLDISRKQNEFAEDSIEKTIEKLDEARTQTKLESAKDLLEDAMQMLDNLRPESQEIIVEPKNQTKFDAKVEQLERKGKIIGK